MLATLFSLSVLLVAPQDALTQGQYNAFMRCRGEIFGHYRAGVIVYAGDDAGVADVEAASKPMDEFLTRMDAGVAQSGLNLDLQSGYAAYQSGVQRWDGYGNRPDARQQWAESDPLTPQCTDAITRVAAFLQNH